MEKDKKKGKNILQRYNGAEAKKNVKYTAMKTGVDAIIGTSTGAGLAAAFGIWSPLLGVIMIGAGHYFGDKTGLLKVSGAATIAYGIAKAKENRAATDEASVNGVSLGSLADGAKERLIDFKDNWLKAFYLDKLSGKKGTSQETKTDASIGAIDMSELDTIEEMVKESAIQFEMNKIEEEEEALNIEQGEFEDDDSDSYRNENLEFDDAQENFEQVEEDLEGLSYALIEEEIDFSTI